MYFLTGDLSPDSTSDRVFSKGTYLMDVSYYPRNNAIGDIRKEELKDRVGVFSVI